MKTEKIELNLKDIGLSKFLKDPLNGTITHLEALLSFREASKLKKGNANVRAPESKKRPYRAMLQTIETEPTLFHLKNRGITYICSGVEIDEEEKKIYVTVPAGDKHDDRALRFGIADGGHTFQAIRQTIQDEKAFENITTWQMPFVRVHFMKTNDQDIIEPIVEALNTSSQVQAYSLDEYLGKFEELKHALAEDGFDPDMIAFRENEDKEWNVIEVIQRMACFLKDRWIGSQPAGMYKSKGKALRLYTNEDTRSEFRMLYPIIKDVLTLPEFIQSEFSRGNIDGISAKSLAKLKSVKTLKKTATREGTNYQTDHRIDLAGLLPIAAGFRELLVRKGDRYAWRMPYKQVFAQCAPRLYSLLVEKTAQVGQSNQLSSDLEYWAGCANIVSRTRADMVDDFPERTVTRKKKVEVEENDGAEADAEKET